MENNKKILYTTIQNRDINNLRAGEMVYLTGDIYLARDAAHKKLVELIDSNKPLPFDIKNQVVYYAGPCPNRPEQVIGSIGPTTSARMDLYSPKLIENGLIYMIGKGYRNEKVKESIKKYKGIYFIAISGAAALMSKCVESSKVICFEELGTEAVRKIKIKELPLIVGIDTLGNDVYNNKFLL